ncbi:MAG: hypothetical protein QNJ30_25845, partial [Kiloniellales bacterium]|nr:hypothetical protein [Kiloniellales bacterium]
LPDAMASRRGPRLPGGPPRAIKWVIINAPWYKRWQRSRMSFDMSPFSFTPLGNTAVIQQIRELLPLDRNQTFAGYETLAPGYTLPS